MRRLGVGVMLAAAATAAGCQPLDLDGFFYDPLKAPPEGYGDLSTPPSEAFLVTTRDGQSLDGVFIPSSGRRSDITLIYFHGQNSNLGTTWPRLQDLYPLGYNIVMVDPRGYGKSTGKPDEAGLQIDEQDIFLKVAQRVGNETTTLVLYGRSLGSGLAIDLAYQDRSRTDAPPARSFVLITESAFASVASFVNDASYVELPSSFVSNSSWNNLEKIKSIEAPYLLFHGTADDYVDPRYSDQLVAAHGGTRHQLVRVEGADHSNVPETMGLDAYRSVIQAFVEPPPPAAPPPTSSAAQ